MEERLISDLKYSQLLRSLKERFQLDYYAYEPKSVKESLNKYMAQNNIASVSDLILTLETADDVKRFGEKMTVNHTALFRNPEMWITLRDKILPSFKPEQQLKIWHAACSSGEESISMQVLLHEMGRKSEVHGTDISNEVLEIARSGRYHVQLKDAFLKAYRNINRYKDLRLYCQVNRDHIQFKPEFYNSVSFFEFDLINNIPVSKYDIILCRNVLIYFKLEEKKDVIRRMVDALNPNGLLIIGHLDGNFIDQVEGLKKLDTKGKIYQKI